LDCFVAPFLSRYQSSRGILLASCSMDSLGRQPGRQPSRQQRESSRISPFLGWPRTPLPSDYQDRYRQVQLPALVPQPSQRFRPWLQLQAPVPQVSQGFRPRLYQTNTKVVGAQVSLQVDSAVQCSLGSLTLPGGPPLGATALQTYGHPALYSPLLDRCPSLLPGAAGCHKKEDTSETTPEEQKVENGGGEQQEGQAEAVLLSQETAETPREKAAVPKRRSSFQVFEKKYGYFQCKDCKTRWESAYVWCIPGTKKVCFKQLCRICQKGLNPYRVEAIRC
ncbi:ZAR1L protein, partial [Crotophaga sulcirostris]|nr:ZAR1L protein [Crotophaga sulcirostris]